MSFNRNRSSFMNTKDVERLVALIENTDISEIEFQNKEDRIRIKRQVEGTAAQAAQTLAAQPSPQLFTQPVVQQAPVTQQAPQASTPSTQTSKPESPATGTPANCKEITSPFVGTFYRAPAPGADAFVEVGQRVKKGDTLCIVEAMKLMNEIEAECDGVIKEILADNAQPVEFGEVLFLIERS